MYQTIESKSPLGRKLLLLLAGVLVVGGIIYGTQQFAKTSLPDTVEGPEFTLGDPIPVTEQEPEAPTGANGASNAISDSQQTDTDVDSDGELESPEETGSAPAEKLIVNERVIRTEGEAQTEEPDFENIGLSQSPLETHINRITVVEQPDLSDIFQATNYVKGLNITAATQDGKRVIIKNEVFYIGDFIEGSQTIRYLGRSQDGVLLFGAHGKKIPLRL